MTAPAEWAYFIYYRLEEGTEGGAPWSALFREVEAATGITGRLYGPAPDGRTWMEVYEPVPAENRAAFEEALAAALERTGLNQRLAGGETRHVERFPRSVLSD
jgi:hypothetical protein